MPVDGFHWAGSCCEPAERLATAAFGCDTLRPGGRARRHPQQCDGESMWRGGGTGRGEGGVMRRCTVRGEGLRHSSGAAGSGVQDGGWWLAGCQEPRARGD